MSYFWWVNTPQVFSKTRIVGITRRPITTYSTDSFSTPGGGSRWSGLGQRLIAYVRTKHLKCPIFSLTQKKLDLRAMTNFIVVTGTYKYRLWSHEEIWLGKHPIPWRLACCFFSSPVICSISFQVYSSTIVCCFSSCSRSKYFRHIFFMVILFVWMFELRSRTGPSPCWCCF